MGPTPTHTTLERDGRKLFLYALLIIFIGCTTYSNSFRGVFLLDDIPCICERNSFSFAPLEYLNLFVMAGRRYFVGLTLLLNDQISGQETWSFHVTNLTIHIGSSLAIFGIVRRTLLTDRMREKFGSSSHHLGFAVALIFIVHPLQTQSVTYVIQRSQSLMGMFQFLALYFFIRGQYSLRRHWWHIAAILSCILGLDSKPHMIGMPIAIAIYDRVFVSRSFKEMFQRHALLYLGIAWVWIVNVGGLARIISDNSGIGVDVGSRGAMADGAGGRMTKLEYALTQFEAISHYLRLSIWPNPLCLDYVAPVNVQFKSTLPYALLIVALGLASVVALRVAPAWGFVGTWFFLSIGPSSSIVPRPDTIVEHRMYVPLVSIIVAIVVGGHILMQWLVSRFSIAERRRTLLAVGMLAFVLVPYITLTIRRNSDYHSAFAMWTDVVELQPGNPRAHNNLGLEYRNQQKLDMAEKHFRQALQLNPLYWQAAYNLGLIFEAQGKLSEAIAQYERTRALNPSYMEAIPQVVNAHNSYGLHLRTAGDLGNAEGSFRSALLHDQKFWQAHFNLGLVLAQTGRNEGAASEFMAVLNINPEYQPAKEQLSHCEYSIAIKQIADKKWDKAAVHLVESVRYLPTFTPAVQQLAEVYKMVESINHQQETLVEAAQASYDAFIRNPDDPAAQYNAANNCNNLGLALREREKFKEAAKVFREAIKVKPDYWQAHFNLALVLDVIGEFDQAAKHYETSLLLNPKNTQAHYLLANALNNHGLSLRSQSRLNEAEKFFRDSIGADNTFWQAQYNLGLVKQSTGQWLEASGAFNAVLRLNPNHAEAIARLREIQAVEDTRTQVIP